MDLKKNYNEIVSSSLFFLNNQSTKYKSYYVSKLGLTISKIPPVCLPLELIIEEKRHTLLYNRFVPFFPTLDLIIEKLI